jgi:hypothetical protein
MAHAARLAATVTIVAFGWTGAALAAESDTRLVVRIDNQAAVADSIVNKALAMTAGIYRRSGISVELTAETDAIAALTVVILSSTRVTEVSPAHNSIGVTPSPDDGTRGTVAYVFADRVAAFATDGRLDLAMILGCVVAHELGNLLLPVNAHTRDGIMRANWDAKSIARSGVPGFAPEQARLLRLRVAGRMAPR